MLWKALEPKSAGQDDQGERQRDFQSRHGHQPGVLDGAGRDRAGFSAANRLRCAVLDGVSYCNELKGCLRV